MLRNAGIGVLLGERGLVEMNRVLFVTAELTPLVHTGGLGDAVAGLAHALHRKGLDVAVAMPRYHALRKLGEPWDGSGDHTWYRHRSFGLPVYLYDDPDAFLRPGIYGPEPGTAYDDNWLRFGRFALAAADLAAGFDLVHLQDAHAGAVALLSPVPSVFTIHNAAFPILGPLEEVVSLLGLDESMMNPDSPLEWYGQANYLTAGLRGASQATTVSPTYAGQLSGDDEFAAGLGGIVRRLSPGLRGILNGVDYKVWDPARDRALPAPYSVDDLTGRDAARRALFEAAGLSDGMLFGNIGRMSEQKGIDLLDPHIDALVEEGLRLVLVGTGVLDELIGGWVARHPKAIMHYPYDEDVAHLVFAGSDAYLMPSRFEPCGIGQMYAMRYGTPPVVHLTGGLADTVIDIDTDPRAGNGFGFVRFDADCLADTIRRAMGAWAGRPDVWHTLQERGMSLDLSWARRAEDYLELYRELAAAR
jgi:starch synthase